MRGKALGTLGLALTLLALTLPAEAATLRGGERVSLAPNEVVPGDLYLAGGQVTVDGHVRGDLVVAGGDVTVRGPVDGDLIAMGGTVRLLGRVGQAVRSAGGKVIIGGPLGGDLLAAGGDLTTRPSASVRGESYMAGGQLRLDGKLGRALHAQGGDLRLDGQVAGPADLRAPTLVVAADARVAGPLAVETRTVNPISPQARVGGVTVNTLPEPERGGHVGVWLLRLGMAMLFGMVLLWLVPDAASRSERVAREQPGWRMLLGLGVLVGTPVVALLAIITLIGLPLGVVLMTVYAVALYLAQLVAAWATGRLLLAHTSLPAGMRGQLVTLLVGLVVLFLLKAIPVVGMLVSFVALIWGLGTLAVLAYLGYQERHPPAALPPPAAAPLPPAAPL